MSKKPKMLARAVRLYGATLHSIINRLRYDLAREITVAISSFVLLATFAYIFNDFLNVQVASLSASMRQRFATYLASAFLLITAMVTGRCLGSEWTIRCGFAATARALGDSPALLKTYRCCIYISLLSLAHGGAWMLVYRWLVHWPILTAIAIEVVMLSITFTLVAASWRSSPYRSRPRPVPAPVRPPRKITSLNLILTKQHESKHAILCRWRLVQILTASRVCRLALCCSSLFMLLIALAASVKLPAFVAAATSLASGLLIGLCLCFQIAEDLEYAWFERCLGVAHQDFIAAYERAGMILGASAAGVAGLCYLGGAIGGGAALTTLLAEAATVALVAATPALIAPSLLLQIDGRRVFVTALTLAIVSLFIATAIIAHWLSVVLIPLLRYFANNAQIGRFYRA